MKLRYDLIRCTINGKPYYMNGIEVDDKIDTKRVTHPGSHNAIGYVKGERTIDFTFTESKDQRLLYHIYNRCITDHDRFQLILFSKNTRTGRYDPVLVLSECTLNSAKSSIKSKEEWKPAATGYALHMERLNTQFEANDLKIAV